MERTPSDVTAQRSAQGTKPRRIGTGGSTRNLDASVGFFQTLTGPFQAKDDDGLWAKDTDTRLFSSQGYSIEEKSAAKIARCWLRYAYPHFVDKDNFAQRLELEDNVSKGVQRLIIYSIIAAFLLLSLSVGIPNSEKLDVKRLVESELYVDEFLQLKTSQELRDFLPQLSRRFKRFSMSSNDRLSGDIALGRVLLQKRVEFVRSRPVFTFNPDISSTSFTFAAWVERLPGSGADAVAIVRGPMESDQALNCWGWYEPPQLRFGAHDFHTTNPDNAESEEVVGLAGQAALQEEVLSHEVMVVNAQNVTFFRNGLPIGEPQPLPRKLTDCINAGIVELGGAGLALSVVKYYSRALKPTEVNELYQEGAPLADLASGSVLAPAEEGQIFQVAADVQEATKEMLDAFEASSQDSMASSKIGLSAEAHGRTLEFDFIFPFDPSPPAVLPKGFEVFQLLPTWEGSAWGAAGLPTSGHQVSEWRDGGDFFSVWEVPVHADGSGAGRLPQLDTEAQGLAVSFWFKPHVAEFGYGPNVVLEKEAEGGVPAVRMSFTVQLDWVEIEVLLDDKRFYRWVYLTKFDEASGKIGEQWLLYAFAQDPSPQVWRHLLFQYDAATAGVSFFLDGKLVIDTATYKKDEVVSTDGLGVLEALKQLSVSQLLSNATINPNSWSKAPEFETVPGKVAQLRVYPRRLSPAEIEALHDTAEWPAVGPFGTVRKMRQCSAEDDDDYTDSNDRDANLHSCSWYATQVKRNPFVCSPSWAKDLCPVTCSGRRLCHDGSLYQGFQAPERRRVFKIFESIKHIVPRKDADNQPSSILCTSDQMDRVAVVAECRRVREENERAMAAGATDLFYTWRQNFTNFYNQTFEEIRTLKADVRDCEVLEEKLADEQCTWDGSFLEDFESDMRQTGTWAMSWWVRPKAASTGMPTNFFFAISFFSRLATPLILNHWAELEPKMEPWMDSYIVTLRESGETRRQRAAIWPTSTIDYAGAWTMMYAQMETRADGSRRFCSTMNAIPYRCSDVEEKDAFGPGEFLQAIEFTTEMLVSPIELTTGALSKAEVQKKYYLREVEMSKRLGPAAIAVAEQKTELLPFDNRAVLIAPPIIWQTRRERVSCDEAIAQPVLEAQLELIKTVHCVREGLCTNLAKQTLFSCRGSAQEGKHFGRSPSELGGKKGFSDFLYSVADTPLLVRNGDLLQTENFIDALTERAAILSIFLSPATGLTSEVVLYMDFSGKALHTRVQYDHLNLVLEKQYVELAVTYGVLFLTTLVMLIIDCYIFKHVHHVASRTAQAIDRSQVKLIAADLLLSLFVLAFSLYTLISALDSERRTSDVIGDIASIPFADPAVSFSIKVSRFFGAIDQIQVGLWYDSQIGTVAFALMVLMLCRILVATAVHPQLRVLFGSLQKASNDLWHFGLVLLIIYFFFSFTALWLFSDEREDFATFSRCFVAEFEMLMGRLPKDFMDNTQLSVFVTLSILVQFFLMRHFCIAILMGGYNKNRQSIDQNPVLNGFLTDVVLTVITWNHFRRNRWPSRRRLSYLLRNKVSSRKVNYVHLRLMLPDIPSDKLRSLFQHYHNMPQIASSPPAWLSRQSLYIDTSYQYLMKQTLMDIWNQVVPRDDKPNPRRRHSMTMQGKTNRRDSSPESPSRVAIHSHRGSQEKMHGNLLRLSPSDGVDTKRDERQLVVLTGLAPPRLAAANRALDRLSHSLLELQGLPAAPRQDLKDAQAELAGLAELLHTANVQVCGNHGLVGQGPQLLEEYEERERTRLAAAELAPAEADATRHNLVEIARLRAALPSSSQTEASVDSPHANGRHGIHHLPPNGAALHGSPGPGASLPAPRLIGDEANSAVLSESAGRLRLVNSECNNKDLRAAPLQSNVQLGDEIGFV